MVWFYLTTCCPCWPFARLKAFWETELSHRVKLGVAVLLDLQFLSGQQEFLGALNTATGEAVMQWKDEERKCPLLALAFNHRGEAFHRADSEVGGMNSYVDGVRAKGLSRVPVLHPGTSEKVVTKSVRLMNAYHGGSGANFIDYLQEAADLESAWKAHALSAWITSHNPRYSQLQQKLILSASQSADFNSFFTCWEHYKDSLALVHALHRLNIKDMFLEWCHKNVSFLEESMVPQRVVTIMHSLTLLILGNMRKYYCKTLQGVVVLECLRFAAQSLAA